MFINTYINIKTIMDSIVTKKILKDALKQKVSRKEAEEAVKTLIKWAGDDLTEKA